jgi:host factor-I protein
MMMTKVINLQDSFLNQIRKENNSPVIIYLINGFQLRGVVKGFDNFTILIENDGKQQLVYKHAISTITPLKQVTTAFQAKKDDPPLDK